MIKFNLSKDDFYPLATVRKLEEAEFFIGETHKYLKNKSYWFLAGIMFNAFISSIWSVTKYLQKELSNLDEEKVTTGAREWYERKIESVKGNEICEFFYKLRTEAIHNFVIDPIPMLAYDGKHFEPIGFAVDYRYGDLKKYEQLVRKNNILNLAQEHFKIIEALVIQAVENFGFKDKPCEPFFSRPGYLKTESRIKMMEEGLKLYPSY